jgi:hypothetical protein
MVQGFVDLGADDGKLKARAKLGAAFRKIRSMVAQYDVSLAYHDSVVSATRWMVGLAGD